MEQAEARGIRRRVLEHWLEVLSALEHELHQLVEAGEPLDREYVDKCRIAADQIRRDTKVKPVDGQSADDVADPPAEPADRIKKLKLKLVS